jgi:penicillin-insensitive murein endopeptidase
MPRFAWLAVLFVFTQGAALAQDPGTLNPQPLPPLANPNDPKLAAKQLFGRALAPTEGPAEVLGFYAKGCLAGASQLPINGPTWQVMRLSRNRNWGHPLLISLIERVSSLLPKISGWPGLLIGDMSQPRGGPMITGHASHQVGLDADIWLTPMPKRQLSRAEREEMSATMMVAPDRREVDHKLWTPSYTETILAMARESQVERIFVNAAIKKALCREAGHDRGWLSKIRPYWGHDYHFHVRIQCPADSPTCEPQPEVPSGDGCGKELDWWFRESILHPPPPKVPPKPRPALTLKDLPSDCRQVVMEQ